MDIKTIAVAPDDLKQKPTSDSELGFGELFTDYAFYMNYTEGEGWHDARIAKYQPIVLEPAALVLHYGQEIFEGLKAYWGVDDKVRLFRPEMNLKRMNNSAERMCMPKLDVERTLEAIEKLVTLEKAWIPHTVGTSLYIRPTMIATEPRLGVKVSANYLFFVILSPVGAYYPEGFSPTKIFVESEYVRSVPGSVGFAKTSGNYAASLLAAKKAKAKGFSQVLWLDAKEHKYVEEIGTSNVMFYIDDEVVTSPLTGSILPGITRDSVIHILQEWGVPVKERMITIDEVWEAAQSGALKEVFATGTAAIISPVGLLHYQGEDKEINGMQVGELSQKLYDELLGVQYGKKDDPYGWTRVIA